MLQELGEEKVKIEILNEKKPTFKVVSRKSVHASLNNDFGRVALFHSVKFWAKLLKPATFVFVFGLFSAICIRFRVILLRCTKFE